MNKVILIGNLGRDPEIRYTGSGTAVANFSVATQERKKNAKGGWEDATEWHDVVAFGKTADLCGQYLGKGSRVAVDGKLQTRKWQDKQGQNRKTTEIVAERVEFLSPKKEGAAPKSEQPAKDDDIDF